MLFVLFFSVRVFVVLHLVGVDVLFLIVALQVLVLQLAEEKDSELMLPLLDEHLVAVQVFTAARLGIKRLSLLLLVLFIGFLEIAQILRSSLHLEGRIALSMYPVELSLHRSRSWAFALLLRGTIVTARRRVLVDATLEVDFTT